MITGGVSAAISVSLDQSKTVTAMTTTPMAAIAAKAPAANQPIRLDLTSASLSTVQSCSDMAFDPVFRVGN
jgi:hypothetical protein